MKLYEKIEEKLQDLGFVNIVICGSTCSGKTTLAQKIKSDFEVRYPVTIVSEDDYFKNFQEIPRNKHWMLLDSIEAFCVEEFKTDVEALMKNGVVMMPRYDVSNNLRESKNKIVRKGKINIFEGLHTISVLAGLENCIKVYIDTNQDVCLQRRITRDTTKYKIPEVLVRKFWNECIRPMSEKYVYPQKEFADIVVS